MNVTDSSALTSRIGPLDDPLFLLVLLFFVAFLLTEVV